MTMRLLYFLLEFFLFLALLIVGRFDFSRPEIPIAKAKTIIVDDSAVPVVGTKNVFNWSQIVRSGKTCNVIYSRLCSEERESELLWLVFHCYIDYLQQVVLFVGPKIVFPFHEFW